MRHRPNETGESYCFHGGHRPNETGKYCCFRGGHRPNETGEYCCFHGGHRPNETGEYCCFHGGHRPNETGESLALEPQELSSRFLCPMFACLLFCPLWSLLQSQYRQTEPIGTVCFIPECVSACIRANCTWSK